jgi:serine/threonine protein kinase
MGQRHFGSYWLDLRGADAGDGYFLSLATMGAMMFGLPLLFPGTEEDEVLAGHARVFGDARIEGVTEKREKGTKLRKQKWPKPALLEIALPHARQLITADAIDLLEKMIVPDAADRISAEEALRHPFVAEK